MEDHIGPGGNAELPPNISCYDDDTEFFASFLLLLYSEVEADLGEGLISDGLKALKQKENADCC